MLEIQIPGGEFFDDSTQKFKKVKRSTLRLEHSLLSISKWEAKWKKPFLGKEPKSSIETTDYIRCMTINSGIKPIVYEMLTSDDYTTISDYVGSSMTATTFYNKNRSGGSSGETVTSELIYYWMVSQQIPFSCEKWHLNRLLTLIKICSIKNAPSKKMNKRSIMSRNSKLNAARRKKMNTKG